MAFINILPVIMTPGVSLGSFVQASETVGLSESIMREPAQCPQLVG